MNKKPAVIEFIDRERQKGTPDKEIQHMLMDAGWHMDIIQNAFEMKLADKILPAKATPDAKFSGVRRHPVILAVLVFILVVLLAIFV